jgi:L-asparaginase
MQGEPTARPVRLLAAGGTIAMRGEQAVPALDASQLIEQLPARISRPEIRAESVLSLPSAQVTPAQALELARRAAAAAEGGEGAVITTGTDTMEELAVLCSFLYGGQAPLVLTGANRPDSGPGADGPANLVDAVTLASAPHVLGLGAVVVFGGEIHAGMSVRKVDSTGPTAFGSPAAGPIGRIVEGRLWLHATPIRPQPLPVSELSRRVEIVTAALGDDGTMLRAAAAAADGVVVVALGAGHLPPRALDQLRRAAERMPVVVTCRPDRSSMLFETYGFEGAERDLRASGAVCAPFLSAPAARIALLCCLGAGLDRDGVAAALAPWDAQWGAAKTSL